jgi:hypothetical protein
MSNLSPIEALQRIEQFSDSGDYATAIVKMKAIATEALAYKGEDEGFLNFIVGAKNNFVKKVDEQKWNNELRMEAENIIIAYDQMMNKLFDCNWVISSYKAGEDLERGDPDYQPGDTPMY